MTPLVPGRVGDVSTLDTIFEDNIPNLWAVRVSPSLSETIDTYHADHRYELLAFAEHPVACLVADGVSRTGLGLQHNIWALEGNLTEQSADTDDFTDGNPNIVLGIPFNNSQGSTPLQMQTEIEGFGYKIRDFTGIFAATILFVHLAIVVLHVLAVFVTKRTGSVWTSVTEILFLALSSHPLHDGETREMLSCGATGVETFKTLRHRVSVRVSAVANDPTTTKVVELQLGARQGDGVEVEQKYGAENTTIMPTAT